MAREQGAFSFDDVVTAICDKMVRRHPHVFGDEAQLAEFAASTGDEVMQNWDAHKKREKPERESVLDGIATGMPALALASKVLGKAEKIGLLEAGAHALGHRIGK